LYPNVRVSLDGRYEVAYEDQVMLDHDRLFKGTEDWSLLLEKYPCDAVLVDQNSGLRPLLEVFREEHAGQPVPTCSRWQFVYEDDAFVVLARNATPTLPYRDSRSEPLLDGAHLAFSTRYSSRARRLNNGLVSQVLSQTIAAQ
jgi:hypothetical protein